MTLNRVLVGIVFLLFSWSAHAEVVREYLSNPSSDGIAHSRSSETINVLSEIRNKAKTDGKVRIIVGLKVRFAPEGSLSLAAALEQKSEIQSAARGLRQKLVEVRIKNLSSVREFPSIPFMAMIVTPTELEFLLEQPEIISIELDRENKAFLVQSSPIVGAPTAWAAGYTGLGKAVAVLDTGVDKTHAFLSGKIVSEACYSGGGLTSNSFCPGGALSSTALNSGINCPLSFSGCKHGTHVAGIVAGSSAGMSGVAKNASIIAIQVFSKSGTGTTAYFSDINSALQRVYDLRISHQIAAVNMSLGGGRFYSNCDNSLLSTKTLIDNLRSVNIATVIASGNESYTDSIAAPACISTAVSVGATWDVANQSINCDSSYSSVDRVACFSNSASFLSLLAPGIWTSSSTPGGAYEVMAGTSMAAPHVAGAWAVIAQASPGISVTSALNALIASGSPVTDYRNAITKRRISVGAAITSLTPTVSIGSSTYSISEGTASVTIPVTRTSTTGSASVAYATTNGTAIAGSDYTAKTGTLSFAPGVSTANIVVLITNDTSTESNETFSVSLSSPSGLAIGSPGSTTVTIVDNDILPTVSIGSSTYSVSEGTASVTIPVTRTSTTGSASVAYATTNGTAIAGSDYTAKTGTLSFAPGVSTANIVVLITNDTSTESNETFSVSLSSPSGLAIGSPGSTTVTIVDNDILPTVSIGSPTYSVSEGTASVTIPVTRTSTTGSASVAYATTNGTAIAGSDYTAKTGTLSFAPGVSTANIVVLITNDTSTESNETFSVSLSSPSGLAIGSPGSTTVTIVDNDILPTVSIGSSTYSVSEGTASVTIPVTRTSTTGSASVAYATTNGTAIAGSDYTAKTGTLSFAPGVSTANIVVLITNDTSTESNETFSVSLSSPSGLAIGSPGSTTVTIVDNDILPTVSIGSSTYSVSEGTASVTIPVTRTSTTGSASVAYATTNGTAIAGSDYTAKTGTLSFAPGVSTANIVVLITNDTSTESNETFSVSLSSPSGLAIGSPGSTTVTIVDNDILPTVSIGSSTYSVSEGTASVTIPVTRTSTTGSASVAYATTNGTAIAGSDYTAKTGTLSFAPGVSTANIVVLITNDTSTESNETFSVSLSSPSGLAIGSPGSTTVTIVDNDAVTTASWKVSNNVYCTNLTGFNFTGVIDGASRTAFSLSSSTYVATTSGYKTPTYYISSSNCTYYQSFTGLTSYFSAGTYYHYQLSYSYPNWVVTLYSSASPQSRSLAVKSEQKFLRSTGDSTIADLAVAAAP